jgi:hypothetical protein
MALLIKDTINVMGLMINQLYLRIEYQVDSSGKNIITTIYPYFNKEAFVNGKQENVLKIAGVKYDYMFAYSRDIDGNDILLFIHNKIKKELSTDIYKPVTSYETDPSTGELLLDPSTGQPYIIDVLVKAKLTNEENISVIDVK